MFLASKYNLATRFLWSLNLLISSSHLILFANLFSIDLRVISLRKSLAVFGLVFVLTILVLEGHLLQVLSKRLVQSLHTHKDELRHECASALKLQMRPVAIDSINNTFVEEVKCKLSPEWCRSCDDGHKIQSQMTYNI